MKRHVQEPGIRKWSGTDLTELQSEQLKVLDGFFGNFGPMVISGCNVVGNIITPGIVILPELVEGNKEYRIATFEGATNVTKLPAFLKLEKNSIPGEYVNAGEKAIAYEYKAVVNYIDGDLPIDERGSRTFKEVLQDSRHRFVTDEEKECWNNKPSAIQAPFAIFDGKATGGVVLPQKAPEVGFLGQVQFHDSQKTFVRKHTDKPGRQGVPFYYTDWNGREEYTEFFPDGKEQTTIPYLNKLYLCEGVLYYWNGEELSKIGTSERENFTALINRPSINGVLLEGDLSLERLGLKETTYPFVEIVDEEVTLLAASTNQSIGDIVFLNKHNAFALRVSSAVGAGMVGQRAYYGNWIGAQEYVEFYTPPTGDGTAITRPPLGRIYSIGQVKYFWDGNGLKIYGNDVAGKTEMPEFDGIVENVKIEMASTTYAGRILFARSSYYNQATIPPENLNMFVIYAGGKYFSNFPGREKYADETFTPYPQKMYKSGGRIYMWDGNTLCDVGTNPTLSLRFGDLLGNSHSEAVDVKKIIGNDFNAFYNTIKNNPTICDITQSGLEQAQVTAQCKIVGNKRQVVLNFPFEYHDLGTMSSLTINDDCTADSRHFKLAQAT